MDPIAIKPVFVKTPNVRNFETMMRALALARGEGRLGLVWSRAGRGKTRTAQAYVANTRRSVYILALSIWRNSQTEFLKKLAYELGVKAPPHRTGPLFAEVAARLTHAEHTIIIDEIDKLPGSYLELVRDLSDYTATPIVLIGEEELPGKMIEHRRVWSRTYQQVEFRPIGVADIVQYVTASSGIRLTPEGAEEMHRSSEGDFRIVRRDLINLVPILNAKGLREADAKAVRAAVRHSLNVTEPV